MRPSVSVSTAERASVVQDQDARVTGHSAGDGCALPLPAGKRHSALAQKGLVPLRKPLDFPR